MCPSGRHRGGGCEPPRARHDHPAARCRRRRPPPPGPAARPTPARRHRQALAQDTAPTDHATPVLPGPGTPCGSPTGALAPALASARHPPRCCRSLGLPRRLRMQDGAHAAPASGHGPIGRHGSPHDDGLGPRLPWGLRRAGVAAMLQGTRCVWPAAVVPGLLCPGLRQKARLRSSNPTLAVSRAQQPQRGTSEGCWASAPVRG